ncbi:similar to Saccharomyces cerevisiae YDL161W ENT1 Epsin-like protein involved in endocytosis and actin patch assembly and functionally redundant with Ent2p [Maudiozyma saulgeensis]|uniref:Similar to Saccharomyces cerevisiae YDL161W ENT1 Epsin-like protein involved in endocytosis and actin patch assembly and functionally redundant with Ent2p n=1 Tax=Maudiozyma saulgeensis TaxID=1789683 RepID=A0A1X7QZ41_9SACH|nr:similar to Saccharomyces cerevisiae YDL161W ENT1 Epsin-like protein involved in endocytosis and actin patch assembly and functionally redundant with Ent2p [Kazachstania saulgeensis]
MLRSAKNIMKGYSSAQVLVRNATANSDEQISRDNLDEISQLTYSNAEFFDIMDMLDKRINDKGKYWRHVAKSMTVLDYLVRFGSDNCVLWCKENLYIIKTLREFRYEDETGVDKGQIIRVKAKELTSLLMDDERLQEERRLNKSGSRRNRRNQSNNSGYDDDLRRAIEASKDTAADEDARRRREEEERRAAQRLLSQEEEELNRLKQLQQQQQQQQQQALLLQQQQQPMYYDIFGNPISPEEYLQYQQQQAMLQQQNLAQQQLWAQQQAFAQQQQLQFQQQQIPSTATGSNNPFGRGNYDALKTLNNNSSSSNTANTVPASQPEPIPQQNVQKPLSQTRTGNQSISDKYSALNTLLASGTGIDTFGNTGEQRIPAQHTKTGTFINSQGTGYKQFSDADANKPNVFLNTQYTGLPSTNIAPSYTGFGFGNQQQINSNNNNNLVDL